MKNWRTSVAGILSVLPIVWKLAQGQTVTEVEIGMIVTAIGLVLAKDAGISGGGM
jgi:hypothetical protein